MEYDDDIDVSHLDAAYEEASDGGNPPDGTYDTEVVEVGLKATSKGDLLYIVKREVLSGDYEGRALWTNYRLSETLMWKLKRDVSAMGLKQYKNMSQLKQYKEEWIGLQHKVRLYKREHEGKTYPEFEILQVMRKPDEPGCADEHPPATSNKTAKDDIPLDKNGRPFF